MTKTYIDLFTPEPQTWGLRGDRQLWAELVAHFGAAPIPKTAARAAGRS